MAPARPDSNGVGEVGIELALGGLAWKGPGRPYEPKVLEGELILTSSGPHELTRVQVQLEELSGGVLLSEPSLYLPRITPGRDSLVPFRLGSQQPLFELGVTVSYLGYRDVRQRQSRVVGIPGNLRPARGRTLVFISHATVDGDAIEPVLAALRRRPSLQIWVAEHEIESADWFPDAIRLAIDQAAVFLVFVSAASNSSAWVEDEIELARDRLGQGRLRAIVPVRLDGSKLPACLAGYDPVSAGGRSGAPVGDEVWARLRRWTGDLATGEDG